MQTDRQTALYIEVSVAVKISRHELTKERGATWVRTVGKSATTVKVLKLCCDL